MQLGGIYSDLDNLARAGMVAAAADDDVAVGVVGQAAVDEGVTAQVLDQGHLQGELTAAADRQVLGPDPDDELAVALRRVQLLIGRAEQRAAGPDTAVLQGAVEAVIAGEPMKEATNTLSACRTARWVRRTAAAGRAA